MLIIAMPFIIVNLIYKKISKKFEFSLIFSFIFFTEKCKMNFVTLLEKVVIKNEYYHQKNN